MVVIVPRWALASGRNSPGQFPAHKKVCQVRPPYFQPIVLKNGEP